MTANNRDLRVQFDRRLRLKFPGSKVSTDVGLLAHRELDEAFRLAEMAEDLVEDSHVDKNKQHGIVPLLCQSIYSRLAGYEHMNDAERLSINPAMRHVVGGRASQQNQQAASTSKIGRFETEMLSTKSNLEKLIDLSGNRTDGEAREDRRKGGSALQVRDVSTGGSGSDWRIVCGDPTADRAAESTTAGSRPGIGARQGAISRQLRGDYVNSVHQTDANPL